METMLQESRGVVDQLIEFYNKYDRFQAPKISQKEVRNTLRNLLTKDRMETYLSHTGKLLGYVESWRINYEQFGRILCGEKFDIGLEDIETGPICYVANTTILPEFKKTDVARALKLKFFEKNRECEYFVGQAKRKRTGLVKVFKKSEFNTWRNEEDII